MDQLLIVPKKNTILRKKYYVYDAHYTKYEQRNISEIMTIKTSRFSHDIKVFSKKNQVGYNCPLDQNYHIIKMFDDVYRYTVYKYIQTVFFKNYFFKERIKLIFTDQGFFSSDGSIVCEKIEQTYKIYYNIITQKKALSVFVAMFPLIK